MDRPIAEEEPGILIQAPSGQVSLNTLLHEMQKQGILCDTVIHCVDKENEEVCSIPVHGCVLASASSLFKDALCGNDPSATERIISAQGLPSHMWKYFIDFIYCYQIYVPSNHVLHIGELYNAAKNMGVQALIDGIAAQIDIVSVNQKLFNLIECETSVENYSPVAEDSGAKFIETNVERIDDVHADTCIKVEEQDVEDDGLDQVDPVLRFLNIAPPASTKLEGCKENDNAAIPLVKKSRKSYSKYKKLYRKIDGKYPCDKCAFKSSFLRPLILHLKIHEADAAHFCNVCNLAFSSKRSLLMHKKNTHLNEEIKCNQCNFSTSNNMKMLLHKQIHQIYQCMHCSFQCPLKSDFLVHLKEKHNHTKMFSCKNCSYSTNHMGALNEHMKVHSTERNFVCSTCDKTFKRKSDLMIHKQTHRETSDHKCDMCQKAFGRKVTLEDHMRVKHDADPLKCGQCEDTYRTSADLYRHVRVKHKGLPVEIKLHKCDICNAQFKCTSHLKRHLMAHRNEKPFKCKECGKAFCTKYDHTNHMRVHTGEKPFKCSFCSYSCNRSSNLKVHERKHLANKDNSHEHPIMDECSFMNENNFALETTTDGDADNFVNSNPEEIVLEELNSMDNESMQHYEIVVLDNQAPEYMPMDTEEFSFIEQTQLVSDHCIDFETEYMENTELFKN